jgi:hypothetical protein
MTKGTNGRDIWLSCLSDVLLGDLLLLFYQRCLLSSALTEAFRTGFVEGDSFGFIMSSLVEVEVPNP